MEWQDEEVTGKIIRFSQFEDGHKGVLDIEIFLGPLIVVVDMRTTLAGGLEGKKREENDYSHVNFGVFTSIGYSWSGAVIHSGVEQLFLLMNTAIVPMKKQGCFVASGTAASRHRKL